jgi:protein kinase C substrate 80K-H
MITQLLTLSRIDCCDGSDEPKGKCPSTCHQMGQGLREELQSKIQSIKSGIKIRNTRAEQGKIAIEAKKQELETRREELKKLEENKQKADQEKERLEKIEEVERSLLREKKALEREDAKAQETPAEEKPVTTDETTEDTTPVEEEETKEEDTFVDDDEVTDFKNEGT